jgi:UDP-glucose 4-epimerase
MKLIITGAAGFIGSVLSVRAVELGHRVLALDDLSRGLNSPGVKLALGEAGYESYVFKRHDCQSGIGEGLDAVLDWNRLDYPGIDAVVHLAAGTGSLDRPYEELLGLNVEMTKRVWQDAHDLGAKVFVFPTTSLALKVPDSPYVRSKEEAMDWLLKQEDRPAKVPLRFFNVVGTYKGCSEKRLKEVHIVPRLVECYTKKESFVINGGHYDTADGTPSRDFTNVLDVVDAILRLTERRLHRKPIPRQPDGAVWLGTSWTTTALQTARIFQQWVGKVDRQLGPIRPFDTGELRCDDQAADLFADLLCRPLTPAWVGIRDEALELLNPSTLSLT